MHAIRIDREGQIDAVIDHKERSVVPAQHSQCFGFLQSLSVVTAFAAVLHHGYPGRQRLFHPLDEIWAWGGDEAQLAVVQGSATLATHTGLKTGDFQVVKPITDRG